MDLTWFRARWRWIAVIGAGVLLLVLPDLLFGYGLAAGFAVVMVGALFVMQPEKRPIPLLAVAGASGVLLLLAVVLFVAGLGGGWTGWPARLAALSAAGAGALIMLALDRLVMEAKQTREQLARGTHEQSVSQALHSSGREVVFLVSGDGQVEAWNPAAEQSFRLDETMRGQQLSEVIGLGELDSLLISASGEPLEKDVIIGSRAAEPNYSLRISSSSADDGRFVVALMPITGLESERKRLRELEGTVQKQSDTLRRINDDLIKAKTRVGDLETQLGDAPREVQYWQGQVDDLRSGLQQTLDEIDRRRAFKQTILRSLGGLPNPAVIVRNGSVLWMNRHAQELFGLSINGGGSRSIEDLLPDLDETVRRDLVADQSETWRAPEMHYCFARRADGLKLRVAVGAVPIEPMLADDPMPNEADLLLVLHDGTSPKVRTRLQKYFRLPWWDWRGSAADVAASSMAAREESWNQIPPTQSMRQDWEPAPVTQPVSNDWDRAPATQPIRPDNGQEMEFADEDYAAPAAEQRMLDTGEQAFPAIQEQPALPADEPLSLQTEQLTEDQPLETAATDMPALEPAEESWSSPEQGRSDQWQDEEDWDFRQGQ
jgi:PAS domain-containing protein